MNKTAFKTGITYLLLFYLSGCSDNGTEQKYTEFKNIVRTDTSGNIIEDDIDDWQPRLPNNAVITFETFGIRPAIPNPAGKDSVNVLYTNIDSTLIGCYFEYGLPVCASVNIKIIDCNNDTIKVILDDNLHSIGFYRCYWDLKDDNNNILPNAIYRLIFEAVTQDTVYKSFGDIMIQR